MSFLSPLFLAGAALIAIPIVLHLLRRDVAPSLPFTAVRLLQKTTVDRSRRHRLRDLLLLAARVCALVLLAGSFARPYVAGAAPSGGTTVVAIDRSFSMSAPGRADRARALAREAIDAAPRGDRVAVIAFDERADVVSPPGAAADARAALADVAPGLGATRYAAAFDKAAELLANEEKGRLILVSDLQRTGFDASGALLPDDIVLVLKDAGAPVSNLSVTSAALDPGRHLATATIRNGAGEPRIVEVAATIADRPMPARRVSVPAGDTIDLSFDAPLEARSIKVSIADPGGYPADDTRYAVFEPRGLPRVLIVTGGPASKAGFYLSRALLAGDEDGADVEVHSVGGAAFSAMPANDVRDQSVVALLSTHGLDRRAGESLRAFVASGGGLLIAASPDVDATVLSTLLEWQPAIAPKDARRPRVLAATDLRHPVFKPFDAVAANFGQVLFDRAWELTVGEGWRVAARFTDGTPALVERVLDQVAESTPGRILLFTSDLDHRWNEFPLHPTFVPFTQETVRYLGARPPAVTSFVVNDVPAGTPAVPGFARVAGRTVAINVDARESSVDRLTPVEFQKMITRTPAATQPRAQRLARETESHQNYWRYGLMLLLATLVVEAFVGSR